MSAHVLQVAFDHGLMQVRALMLQSCGYQVTSVLGKAQTASLGPEALAQFDVAVIGFSSTHAVRSEILKRFKAKAPSLPVVVLQFHSYEKFPEADCATLSEDPERWLAAVEGCVRSR